MPSYLDTFDAAFERYQKKEDRPGFGFGFFSRFRHKYAMYPHIQKLRDDLDGCCDDAESMGVLINYFHDSKTKFNHHSFASYFQEQLVSDFPRQQWENMDPMPVVFYQTAQGDKDTLLYRASRQPKESAFNDGMKEGSHSKNLSRYFDASTYSTGVSTTKSYASAYQYGVNEFIVVTPKGAHYREFSGVYVYVVNYRGLGGVDIDETLSRYGGLLNKLEKFEASGKKEVNIIGCVAPEDIVGAYELGKAAKGVFHANPNYVPDRALEHAESKQDRLGQVFLRP